MSYLPSTISQNADGNLRSVHNKEYDEALDVTGSTIESHGVLRDDDDEEDKLGLYDLADEASEGEEEEDERESEEVRKLRMAAEARVDERNKQKNIL